ncbi:peptidoglycan DD-metalloendopeptidase family protein [Maridesulfovibrio sp.]|uniref:murein hydrolase activator EnvC family protein n=1 Tax=Maridesulfovibrio sp. TaxID=2795000 RepID=UPI002A188F91|nr:peptidoglycan DD-metalloendopeptidase family protein [Maridesulfovibrio sp.]
MSRIKEEIQDTRETVKQQKQALLKLTREERAMFGDLAVIEDSINDAERELFRQEDELERITEEEERIRAEEQTLRAEHKVITDRLGEMLKKLWPVHSRKLENRFGNLDDWQAADRNFVWLASLYKETRTELDKARRKSDEISRNLQTQRELKSASENKLAEINSTKDKLLEDKLSLLSGIRGIRSLKITKEQELKGLLDTINKLNYRLKSLTSRKIGNFKGSLPRPCAGKTTIPFDLSAKPPVRGIGIRTTGNVDVKSIFWGKVVHNDTLRGFGRVVIIYHGYNYYSLYAYLAESFVKTGQEVEKDEIIGKTGYYPNLKETGLYFELRFHQKAVNPQKWLARN